MEIQVLSEQEIEVYTTPDKKVKQRVLTYQAEGFAPRTVWLDADKLPDVAWQKDNPGKAVPVDIQAKGDALRRKAAEADIAKLKTAPKARSI